MSSLFGYLYSALTFDILKFERTSNSIVDIVIRSLDINYDFLIQTIPLITKSIDNFPLLLETKAEGASLILLE